MVYIQTFLSFRAQSTYLPLNHSTLRLFIMGVVYYKEQTIPNVSAFTEDIRYVTSALNIKLGVQMKLKS